MLDPNPGDDRQLDDNHGNGYPRRKGIVSNRERERVPMEPLRMLLVSQQKVVIRQTSLMGIPCMVNTA